MGIILMLSILVIGAQIGKWKPMYIHQVYQVWITMLQLVKIFKCISSLVYHYVLRGKSTICIVCTDFKSINKIKLFSVAENGVCIASDLADRRIKYVTP